MTYGCGRSSSEFSSAPSVGIRLRLGRSRMLSPFILKITQTLRSPPTTELSTVGSTCARFILKIQIHDPSPELGPSSRDVRCVSHVHTQNTLAAPSSDLDEVGHGTEGARLRVGLPEKRFKVEALIVVIWEERFNHEYERGRRVLGAYDAWLGIGARSVCQNRSGVQLCPWITPSSSIFLPPKSKA